MDTGTGDLGNWAGTVTSQLVKFYGVDLVRQRQTKTKGGGVSYRSGWSRCRRHIDVTTTYVDDGQWTDEQIRLDTISQTVTCRDSPDDNPIQH